MERKKFLKSLSLFAASMPVLLNACEKDHQLASMGDGADVSIDQSCTVTPSETEGPFPTKSPSSYVRSDIKKSDGLGVDMEANITIVNVNDNCSALQGAIVDVWHCDVAGNYSQYGGTRMQSTNYQEVHWFRGRQTSNSDGLVTFQTIFPGWYQSRATHIHVHIYNASGNSLLVTQIAFQDSICNTVNVDGSAYGYKKGMTGYTYNANDNVFNDSAALEMSTVKGSLAAGFNMEITIKVSA